ncbi:hypothetical protein HS088_TW06G00807 [Tripterygium wilfordii]|uniref:Protein PLASTID REDOX INSENSITIVE 2 n=1 Tax=Tripterygium wilfordii TaxID=458696 RepID=A0A7J7DKN2_TRIWF|nr:protein PLASTID REDOX INSENSITIVE 2, chloroplastic-like [Tripterygium wilfordii]KAF5746636.1 hypothetical protein HS088_TW06G00807 [Tripterygium wilfordii]
MAYWSGALVSPTFNPFALFSSSSSSSRPVASFLCSYSAFPSFSFSQIRDSGSFTFSHSLSVKPSVTITKHPETHFISSKSTKKICSVTEFKFPDPIPEFANAETEKFKAHLLKRLSKKDIFGDSLGEVVEICTEIFSTFLHTEYGGPGTLLVVTFIDMADTIDERGLPGGPQAARAAVKWAQDHLDDDWDEWTGGDSN